MYGRGGGRTIQQRECFEEARGTSRRPACCCRWSFGACAWTRHRLSKVPQQKRQKWPPNSSPVCCLVPHAAMCPAVSRTPPSEPAPRALALAFGNVSVTDARALALQLSHSPTKRALWSRRLLCYRPHKPAHCDGRAAVGASLDSLASCPPPVWQIAVNMLGRTG